MCYLGVLSPTLFILLHHKFNNRFMNSGEEKTRKILIVDDEPDICEILRFNLEMEGYTVMVSDGPLPLDEDLPDLILLDVMMTPVSGFEWAKSLKSNPRTANIPIIFCTAKTAEEDTLRGFALGSDDYICKPFRVSEVKARVRAVLHRFSMNQQANALEKGSPNQGNWVAYDTLRMDLDRKECYVDDKEVVFTKLEFKMLALLLSHPGRVFSREEILMDVWPDNTVVLDRTVDVNVTRVRKKIGRYGDCIRTKFGFGYMFQP